MIFRIFGFVRFVRHFHQRFSRGRTFLSDLDKCDEGMLRPFEGDELLAELLSHDKIDFDCLIEFTTLKPIMDKDYDNKVAELKRKIKSFPDFPKKGILFWDIFSAMSNGVTCKLIRDILVQTVRSKYPDVEAIVGLESRGFLFSFSLATELEVACVPVRKKGKLPGEVISYKYDLEYGSDVLEIQKDSIQPGLKCLIVDDLIATGGSITAAAKLLQSCGADVLGCLVVMELMSLNGRNNIPVPVHSIIQYD